MTSSWFDPGSTSKTLNLSLYGLMNGLGLKTLRFISILCMFNFIHTLGLMRTPLRKAATTKEKKHGLVSTYELNKNIKFTTPNV